MFPPYDEREMLDDFFTDFTPWDADPDYWDAPTHCARCGEPLEGRGEVAEVAGEFESEAVHVECMREGEDIA